MKYNEYIELRKILNENTTSILEADDNADDTSLKTSNAGVHSWYNPFNFNPKSAIKKKLLDSKAKKLQKNIVSKYTKPIIENYFKNQRSIYALLKQQGDTKDESFDSHMAELKTITSTTLENIKNTVNKVITNYTSKMNSTINSWDIKDSNKMLLQAYWTLLSSQITLNNQQFYFNQIKNFIKENQISNNVVQDITPDISASIVRAQQLIDENKGKVSDVGKKANEQDPEANQNNQDVSTNQTANNQQSNTQSDSQLNTNGQNNTNNTQSQSTNQPANNTDQSSVDQQDNVQSPNNNQNNTNVNTQNTQQPDQQNNTQQNVSNNQQVNNNVQTNNDQNQQGQINNSEPPQEQQNQDNQQNVNTEIQNTLNSLKVNDNINGVYIDQNGQDMNFNGQIVKIFDDLIQMRNGSKSSDPIITMAMSPNRFKQLTISQPQPQQQQSQGSIKNIIKGLRNNDRVNGIYIDNNGKQRDFNGTVIKVQSKYFDFKDDSAPDKLRHMFLDSNRYIKINKEE